MLPHRMADLHATQNRLAKQLSSDRGVDGTSQLMPSFCSSSAAWRQKPTILLKDTSVMSLPSRCTCAPMHTLAAHPTSPLASISRPEAAASTCTHSDTLIAVPGSLAAAWYDSHNGYHRQALGLKGMASGAGRCVPLLFQSAPRSQPPRPRDPRGRTRRKESRSPGRPRGQGRGWLLSSGRASPPHRMALAPTTTSIGFRQHCKKLHHLQCSGSALSCPCRLHVV